MATDVSEGDSEVPFLMVAPADTDTSATLTVYPPTGSGVTVTASGGELLPIAGSDDWQQRWETDEPVTYTVPGRWVLHWTITGTGEGAEDTVVFVAPAPVPGGPAWLPAPARVAAYVPWLTVSLSVPGSQEYEQTFTDDTSPSTSVAVQHIADAANLIAPLATAMPTALYDLAGTVTALYAAASLAAAYARTADDAARTAGLVTRASAAFTRLAAAVDEAGAGADEDEPILIAPFWGDHYPTWELM